MSRYRRGDVVLAAIAFIDKDGKYNYKTRPMIVIDVQYESDNITVSCTSQTHKAANYPSILVKKDSQAGKSMRLEQDTLIYCNETVVLSNADIKRRIGSCPLIKEICQKLGYDYDEN